MKFLGLDIKKQALPTPQMTKEIAVLPDKVLYDFDYDTPDRTIANKGWDYLDTVKKDPDVSAAIDIRSKGLLKNAWSILPASQSEKDIEIAEFVKWVIENMEGSFIDDLDEFMDGVYYGYSLSEIIWQKITTGKYSGKLCISALKSKHPKNWKFKINKSANAYAVVNRDYEDKKYPLNKFLYAKFGRSHKNPYGDAAGVKVAFYYWLKRNGAQFWAIFLEKFGMPTLKVTTPVKPDKKSKAAIDNLVAEFESSTSLKVPEGFEVELMEAKRSGSADYNEMERFCNSQIAKAILAATLINDEGTRGQGSYALASGHSAVLDMMIQFDAIRISEMINKQYIRRLVDLNFVVDGAYPKFKFPPIVNQSVLIQNMPNMLQAGFEFSEQWMHDYFGIPIAKKNEPVLEPKTELKTTNVPKGDSNDKGMSFSDEAESDSKFDQMDTITAHYSESAFNAIEKIFESTVKQLKGKLNPGVPVTRVPDYSVNVGDLQGALVDMGMIAYTEGKQAAYDELKGKNVDLTEYDETVKSDKFDDFYDKYFQDKEILTRKEYDEIVNELKDRYFTVAGLTKADIEKILNTIMLSLPGEWTEKEFLDSVEAAKIKYIGTKTNISVPHIKLVMHNAAMSAYTQGENAMYNNPLVADYVWGYRYYVIKDGRERASHRKCGGVTLPKNHVWWKYHTPPWDHNCRCGRNVVLVEEIENGDEIQTLEADIPDVGKGWWA